MGPRVLSLLKLGTWISIEARPTVQQVLSGAHRLLGDAHPKAKLAISAPMLIKALDNVDRISLEGRMFFTAAVTAFWGILRKGNICVRSLKNVGHCITRNNVVFDDDKRAWLTITSSKTNQYRSYTHRLPLPLFKYGEPGYAICPSRALYQFFHDTRSEPVPATAPAMSYVIKGRIYTLTHTAFVKQLKDALRAIGVDPDLYAGHSLRKGCTTLAHMAKLSPADLKLIGDWHSEVYMTYVVNNDHTKLAAVEELRSHLNRSLLA